MGEENNVEVKKRPGWVWVISIFYIFSLAWTFLSFYMILNKIIPIPIETQEYFSNLGIIDWLLMTIGSSITLIAVVTLFLLKRITIKVWLTSFVFGILSTAYSAIATNWLQIMQTSTIVSTLIGFAIVLAIYSYAKRLDNRGYLN